MQPLEAGFSFIDLLWLLLLPPMLQRRHHPLPTLPMTTPPLKTDFIDTTHNLVRT
jgi:hypothetical protein